MIPNFGMIIKNKNKKIEKQKLENLPIVNNATEYKKNC